MGALAGAVLVAQRQQDVHHRRIGAARDVGDQRRRDDRRLGGSHAERQHTGVAQIVEVVTGDVALGPVLAVAGDRAVDDARVDRGDSFVIEAEPRHHARPELFDHHVGLFEQRHDLGLVGRVLEVEREGLLAAVEHREVDAVGAPARLVDPHLLALTRPLDLDHFRAGLGEEQARHRAGQQRREIEDEDSVERSRHYFRSRDFATTARRAGA